MTIELTVVRNGGVEQVSFDWDRDRIEPTGTLVIIEDGLPADHILLHEWENQSP